MTLTNIVTNNKNEFKRIQFDDHMIFKLGEKRLNEENSHDEINEVIDT